MKYKRLYCDGGTGTLIQAAGDTAPRRELVGQISRDYLSAGSNIICTDTFTLNQMRPDDAEELARLAISDALAAATEFPEAFVAFDIGPTGRLMEPAGDMTFEEAVSIFAENARFAEKYGADLIIIETMTDLNEAKAAVLAAKQNSTLPVFVTNAYGESGRLMTGATPLEAVKVLEAAGADAVGTNCSFGPDKLMPVVEKLVEYASVPVIVSPNAGLPVIREGKTEYDISADEFAVYMRQMADMGACILGGCCGTTPEYIRKTVEATKDIPYAYPCKKDLSAYESEVEDKKIDFEMAVESPLAEAIFDGDEDRVLETVTELLDRENPMEIISSHIIPILDEVGRCFESGELFLSELIMCAEAASVAFEAVKERMPKSDMQSDKKIVIATVKGDVHDIGKDIVRVVLESYGFTVVDLGIDVPPENIARAVLENDCKVVGLSALMTTTVPAMSESIVAIKQVCKDAKVIVGGAVLSEEIAKDIGADFYASSAVATASIAESL